MMKKILLSLGLLLFCTSVFAGPIQKIVFLGDSLSDNGNVFYYTYGFIPKDPPYYQGRFSNGKVWSEQLAELLHPDLSIAIDNYAAGGATAVERNVFKGCLPVTLDNEVDRYLSNTQRDKQQSTIPNTLYVIWMGANDYTVEADEDEDQLVDEVITAINNNVTTLIENGAKQFVLMDLPDFSKTPRGLRNQEKAERLRNLSKKHHERMQELVKQFQLQYPDIKFIIIDVYDIFNDMLKNIDKYNQKYNLHITNITDSCWFGGYFLDKHLAANEDALVKELQHAGGKFAKSDARATAHYILTNPSLAEAYRVSQLKDQSQEPCQDADNHLFWDAIHPTRVTHQLFAHIVAEYLHEQGV